MKTMQPKESRRAPAPGHFEHGGIRTTSMPVPLAKAANLLPNLSSLSRMRYFGPSQHGGGFAKLLGGPGVDGPASHVQLNGFPRAVDHEEEGEDSAEQYIVELQEVARPDFTAVILDESAPTPGVFPYALRASLRLF